MGQTHSQHDRSRGRRPGGDQMASQVQRVDVHHHVLPDFYKDVQRAAGIMGSAYQAFPEWSVDKSLALMDSLRIGTSIVSFTSPGIFYGDIGQTRELARRFNDFLAETVAARPDRFG